MESWRMMGFLILDILTQARTPEALRANALRRPSHAGC
jgi:hypothetical protein